MLDYIIVGSGLAGISFSETLLIYNKSFCVFNTNKNASTKVAAVANLISRRKNDEVVWAEIAKCRVLCANCHAVHTHG